MDMPLWKCLIPVLLLTACRYSGRQEAGESEVRDAVIAGLLADLTGACTKTASGGIDILTVRATSVVSTTKCDLADGGLVLDQSLRFDIAFQRFKIGTASGTSAAASGGACKTNETNFDAVTAVALLGGTTAPDCPFFTADQILSAEAGGAQGSSTSSYSGNSVFQEWYTYNIFGHTLSAKPDVYIVRSSDGQHYYKIQFFDYYSSAGTSGYPALRYREVPL